MLANVRKTKVVSRRRRRARGREWLGRLLWPWVPVLMLGACTREPARIEIKMPQDSVQSTQERLTLPTFTKKGESFDLRASGFDAQGRYLGPAQVKWTSADPSSVVVDAGGKITILKSGTTQVSAKTFGYSEERSAAIELVVAIPARLELSLPEKDPGRIHLAETKQFGAVVLNDRGQVIEGAKPRFSSEGYAILVTPEGLVEGAAMGEAQLVAEYRGLRVEHPIEVLDFAPKARRTASR